MAIIPIWCSDLGSPLNLGHLMRWVIHMLTLTTLSSEVEVPRLVSDDPKLPVLDSDCLNYIP